jgi:hypothetical protein
MDLVLDPPLRSSLMGILQGISESSTKIEQRFKLTHYRCDLGYRLFRGGAVD